MNKTKVQRNYKDTVFRMLFREKENLLELYNALNKTAYTDVESLEITTLENAVYMNYKNDISFVFDFELMLYEHQSTVNPNMPLRDLVYVTKVLQGRIKACRLLREYAQYVEQVRLFTKELPFPEAVKKAVDYCIRNGILADFLAKNRAEAIEMSIFEFDEEKYMKAEREYAYERGKEDGLAEGKAEILVRNVEAVMKSFETDQQKACEALGISEEEYEQAKGKAALQSKSKV